jgi:hypothetical protein
MAALILTCDSGLFPILARDLFGISLRIKLISIVLWLRGKCLKGMGNDGFEVSKSQLLCQKGRPSFCHLTIAVAKAMVARLG